MSLSDLGKIMISWKNIQIYVHVDPSPHYDQDQSKVMLIILHFKERQFLFVLMPIVRLVNTCHLSTSHISVRLGADDPAADVRGETQQVQGEVGHRDDLQDRHLLPQLRHDGREQDGLLLLPQTRVALRH